MAQLTTSKLLHQRIPPALRQSNGICISAINGTTRLLERQLGTRRLLFVLAPSSGTSRRSLARRAACEPCRVFFFSTGVTARRAKEDPVPARHGASKSGDATVDKGKSSKSGLVDGTKVLSQQVRERISVLTPHENIYTLPNILTFSRLLATPVIGYLVLREDYVWAAGLFAYAGISDLVDGWMARKYKLQTVVGSVIDPMADKALMAVLVACLAIKGALPLWLATLIFGRDMSLGIAAIYYRYASLPAPKTFMRYWDFSLPSAEVHPTQVSKWNTFLQLGLIGCTILSPLVVSSGMLPVEHVQTVLQGFQYVVAGTTVWSGASYLWTQDAVVILGEDESLKKRQGSRGRAIIGISFATFLALAAHFAVKEDKEPEGPAAPSS